MTEEWIRELQSIMENGCEPLQLYGLISMAIEEQKRTKNWKEIQSAINKAGRMSNRRQKALDAVETARKQELLLNYVSEGRKNAKRRERCAEIYASPGIKRAAQLYHRDIDMNGGAGLVEQF